MKELLGAATNLVRSVRSHRKSRDEIELDLKEESDVDSDDLYIADEKDGGQTKELNNYLEFYETLQNTFQQHQPTKKDPPFLKRSQVGSPLNDDELVSDTRSKILDRTI